MSLVDACGVSLDATCVTDLQGGCLTLLAASEHGVHAVDARSDDIPRVAVVAGSDTGMPTWGGCAGEVAIGHTHESSAGCCKHGSTIQSLSAFSCNFSLHQLKCCFRRGWITRCTRRKECAQGPKGDKAQHRLGALSLPDASLMPHFRNWGEMQHVESAVRSTDTHLCTSTFQVPQGLTFILAHLCLCVERLSRQTATKRPGVSHQAVTVAVHPVRGTPISA